MVSKVEKVVYQAHASSTGGRDGSTRSSDGLLDVKLTAPKEMGGAGPDGHSKCSTYGQSNCSTPATVN